MEFRTKTKMALGQVDRALGHGVRVSAWTWDEFYSRDSGFLDGMEARLQVYVGEVSVNFQAWVREPKILEQGPKKRYPGWPKKYPRLAKGYHSSEVRNLASYSPVFRKQAWQAYRIKDSGKGPEVWEVQWAPLWRKGADGLPRGGHCLIVARNVLSGEVKYFVANRVPGQDGVTLEWLLRVAFTRCTVERCFREGKQELGMDHFQVRGWRCIHRHYYVTQLTQLFCARIRQEYDEQADGRLTVEQVCGAANAWLDAASLTPAGRKERYEQELKKIDYQQRRNEQSRRSHTKTRIEKLQELGIDVETLPSCILDDT